MKTITLTEEQVTYLTIELNCALRSVRCAAAHALNAIFKQLTGRNHDVYERYYPERCKETVPK